MMKNLSSLCSRHRSAPIVLPVFAWLALVAIGSAAEPDAAGLEFFEKSVRPLLVKHCYECHAAREANGGLVLDTRDGVLKGGDSGAGQTKVGQSKVAETV